MVSACGVECAVLPPAMLSNHTGGFKTWSFADLTGELKKVEEKWIEQAITFDAFYTGYVCESHIDPILSIMTTCAAKGAIRFVDPAMADNGRLYAGFAADFPSKMARLASTADFLLPNLTEAALLVGEDPAKYTQGAVLCPSLVEALLAKLHALGPKNVVLTGVSFKTEELGVAVSDGKKVEYDFNARNPLNSHGTGDVFASVFAGAVLRGKTPLAAAALAADIVCASIEATAKDHWYGVSFERAIPELVKAFE